MLLCRAFRCLVICSGILAPASLAAAQGPARQVVTYDAPRGVIASGDYSVAVSGHPVFVYTATVRNSPPASFANFDFEGSAEVTVNSTRDVQSARILPSSCGIEPVIKGRTIQFTLTQPRNVTIEINGSPVKPLHLFANPLEINTPKPTDPNVLYFGPGLHDIATLTLHDDETLYLAGGAILRGIIPPDEKPIVYWDWAGLANYKNFINVEGAKNIIIRGRGIIDLSNLPWHSRTALVFSKSSNLTIEGITIIGAPCWDVAMFQSSNIHIRNIKEICSQLNSDGIDICNSQDVLVEDCFLRNNDDEICVKTTAPPPAQPSRNIVARNCVIWNDRARGLGITNETRQDIDSVLFRNCDIIHDFSTTPDCAALAVIIDDSGTITNVRFEDIRIEDIKSTLLFCWIGKEMWGHDLDRGHLKGVTYKNITVTGNTFPTSQFSGYDATHLIEDVTIDHLVIQGKPIANAEEGRISTNSFVRNLRFSTNNLDTAPAVRLP